MHSTLKRKCTTINYTTLQNVPFFDSYRIYVRSYIYKSFKKFEFKKREVGIDIKSMLENVFYSFHSLLTMYHNLVK